MMLCRLIARSIRIMLWIQRSRYGTAAEVRACLKDKKHVRIDTTIQNIDRAFGTILSNEVSRAHGANGLAIRYDSYQGQGFGRSERRSLAGCTA
jgi:glutamate synthase domain-containing protein 3